MPIQSLHSADSALIEITPRRVLFWPDGITGTVPRISAERGEAA